MIICLDIDDCIFLNRNTWVTTMDDNFEILEINLKRLRKILDFYDAKIFITSAWSSILMLESSNIIYDNPAYGLHGKSYYAEEFKAFELLQKYLNGYVIGLSCGNRKRDIANLLEQNHKIIAIDDMDLSEILHENYLYLKVNGFIQNIHLYEIYNFMQLTERG
jgi:hypothetical protein